MITLINLIVSTAFLLGGGPVEAGEGNSSTGNPDATSAEVDSLYHTIGRSGSTMPDWAVFRHAMLGYNTLNKDLPGEKEILTIIDFTKPSSEKRLWVIDLEKGVVLYHTLVAHGRNSGELYANSFSNTPSSLQSSLGFYITGGTYTGKHGLSLKLHGMEPGINDKAESRAIVMHGADYVREDYVKKVGRLGRSWGCPALPMAEHRAIIEILKDGTCLFIYHDDEYYSSRSVIKQTDTISP